MKRILVLTTAAFLFSGIAFAGSNVFPSDNGPTVRYGDKGKEKGKKKEKTHKTCPGKECGKKS